MQLRPYQEEARQAVFSEWEKSNKRTLLVLPTGCHCKGQKILKADGSAVNVEDIRVGDRLLGADGKQRTVLHLTSGIDTLYKITPIKGRPFIVTGDHKLSLVRTNTDRHPKYPSEMNDTSIKDIAVSEWLTWSKSKKHLYKLVRSGCIDYFPDYAPREITIDPYVLGILLGDGGLTQTINVTTPDKAVFEELSAFAKSRKMHLRVEPAGKANTYFFVCDGQSNGRRGSQLFRELSELGLMKKDSANKFIPDTYKYGTAQTRKEIVAGLLDSDGYYTCGGYDFVSKSKQLAEDLMFICRSLGLAAYMTPCRKSNQYGFSGTYFRLSISGDCSVLPCRVKKAPKRQQKKSVLRTGFKVDKYGIGEYFGFTVDGDNRYLMDDFTITHNCGKTIVFAKIAEDCVRSGNRVLILAHRGELLEQAADKIYSSTGLKCAVEKAEESCLGSWHRITVGSVQSLQREKRLSQFAPDYFDDIIVDEAHHCISDGYQTVLQHFDGANVLGVTATPDRGDMRNLGTYFDSLAYEYTLPKAIKEGYLSPIKALTLPLKLDLSGVQMQNGDFKAADIDNALDPYLYQIADEMLKHCADRKTVVFLPLIKTSQKFRDILNSKGFRAAEVNGNSKDRSEVLSAFDRGDYNVLCNSMLLTEGWDCPSVDCVIVLRPTKIRSLYCLDEETEILTVGGWKKDIEVGEQIAAFDPETEEICFTPAIAKIRRPLEKDEYFCSLNGTSVNIRVTNKHRLLYDTRRKAGWKFKTAEKVADLNDGCYLPVSGHGNFKGIPLTDDEIRFIGWVMTDGTINKRNNAITITQSSHQPWIEEIQKCIDGCGFKNHRFISNRDTEYHRNSDCVCWTISKGKPRKTDKHLRGWGALEPWISKDVSPLLNDMTERQFDIMLEAIHLADGHKQKSPYWTQRSYHIRKGNKTFIERLQEMGVQRGYRASVSSQYDTNYHLIYCVHLKKQSFVNVGSKYDNRPKWVKEPHTDEMCWCVQNALGTLITRRNGKVAIIGNCQMVGRGTRLAEGKTELLLLDFLWHTERHELCHPAHLICESDEVAKKMTENIEAAGCPVDIEEAEQQAESDVVAQREEALAKKLAEMKNRKRKLVDPLQFELSIQSEDLSNYVPAFGWEASPPSAKQIKTLEKLGIFPDEIDCAGKAAKLLDRLDKRRCEGLTTPKQIRFLESKGFQHVGTWQFEQAKKLIDRIAANSWRTPPSINPHTYIPEEVKPLADR